MVIVGVFLGDDLCRLHDFEVASIFIKRFNNNVCVGISWQFIGISLVATLSECLARIEVGIERERIHFYKLLNAIERRKSILNYF